MAANAGEGKTEGRIERILWPEAGTLETHAFPLKEAETTDLCFDPAVAPHAVPTPY